MLDPDATAKAEGLADILDMCGFQASAVRLSEDEGDPNEAQDKIINALGRAKQNKTDQLLQQIQMMTAPV